MGHENKMLAQIKKKTPINGTDIDKFINAVEKKQKKTVVTSGAKKITLLLLEEDLAKINSLIKFIGEQTGNYQIQTTKLMRTVLHLAEADDKLIDKFNSIPRV